MAHRTLALTLLLCSCSFKVGSPAPAAVAVVDRQRALAECRLGKDARERLMGQYKKDQRELDDEQSRIRRDMELGIGKDQGGAEVLQFRMTALQQRYTTLQSELEAAERKEAEPLTARLDAALAELAKDKGVELVVDKASAPFAKPQLDLTDELIHRFDAQTADAGP
jgi:outer membrane protein